MKYLLGFFVVFEILDGVLTHFLVTGGLGRESNPFMLPLVGDANFLIVKVVGVFLCVLILWDAYKRSPKVALISTSCFVLFCGAIVLWNLTFFIRA